MMKMIRWIAVALFAAVLAACGGGGGSAGTTSPGGGSGGGGGTSDPTTKVADFVMLLDKSTLQNSGTSTAKVTVLAVDSGNNVVPGATVKVTTDANTIFTPGGTVTDASGTFTGTISAGADKSDRTVTITATVNSIVKQTTLNIVGSTLTATTTPAVLTPGGSAVITARLVDAASAPIANAKLTFSGDISSLSGQSANTDANGIVTLSFTAPGTAGAYIVKVAGSGVSSSVSLQVGSGTVIPPATIPAGITPSLQALPNVVAPNAVGSTSNQSQLRFLMIDGSNAPVPNVRVRFAITSTGLGSADSSISTGSSVVYTNASGIASATFVPGSTGSPTDGVKIVACYAAVDFTSAECPNSVQVFLTVAQQGLAISIGNDDKLANNNGVYTKQFVVTVADAAGRAVAGAPVDISVDLPYFGKGTFDQAASFPLLVQPIALNQDIPDSSTAPSAFGARVSCRNQDLNRNGIVDAGETTTTSDGFGQPVLLPRKADLLISYVDPTKTTTDANGQLLIRVSYSMRFATWLEYHIRASTTVAGSQGTAERAFMTTFIKGDEVTGSFLVPPYGVGACNSSQ